MELTQKLVSSLFSYRDDNLYWKVCKSSRAKIGDLAGTLTEDGYRKIQINGKQHPAHRLIFLFHHGYLPEYLDHIDGDKLNNNITNLREATNQQNGMNRKKSKSINGKPTSSIYKGVTWHKYKEKWMSYIKIDDKLKHLGYFTSEIEAAKAYNRAAIKYYGEFARINIIDEPKGL